MINDIKEQVKAVIKYSQNIEEPKVDGLIEEWAEAKKRFIDAFGGFIYTFPKKVSFNLNENEKMTRLNDFVESLCNRWNNSELADFVADMKCDFFNNIMPRDYVCNDGEVIKKGTKIIRAFKYFEKDKNVLEYIQNEASMILQEDKIEGYLSFSVHPLDYLSSSENNYNWRSCHSLDGEYRAGNLSYMLDNSTIVAYLSNGEAQILPNFPKEVPWNSKKWRVLLYLSNDWAMMFAGREYPFSSQNGINLTLNYFSKLTMDYTKRYYDKWHSCLLNSIEFEGSYISFEDDYIPVGQELVKLHDLITDSTGEDNKPLHFNDLLESSFYRPIYAYQQNKSYLVNLPTGNSQRALTHFNIGGYPKCLHCGEKPIATSSTMLCLDCLEELGNDENHWRCDWCEDAFGEDEAGYWVNDYYICQRCYEEETDICPCCGERMFNVDMRYSRKLKDFVCINCESEDEE